MRWGYRPPMEQPDGTDEATPKKPTLIEAWLDGGPCHGQTMRNVRSDSPEVLMHGHARYVRRPHGDVEVPKANRDHTTDASYLFAAYFDFEAS